MKRKIVLWLSLLFVEVSKSTRAQPDLEISIAFVFWNIPDHGDFTTTPYWHDPGFRLLYEISGFPWKMFV
jgi:hypothetical protein